MKAVLCTLFILGVAQAQSTSTTSFGSLPHDPGVRTGAPAAGSPLTGLTTGQLSYFQNGQDAFSETIFVQNAPPGGDNGLGPRFNSNSCISCHAFPAVAAPARW